jgi:hypothetical protein
MSVSDLKYKNKYLKYKNKYLNLQSQIEGINATGGGFLDSLKSMFLSKPKPEPVPVPEPEPVPVPKPSIPDDLISSMLFYSNSLPINRETRRIMNSTTDIDSNKFLSLREKLGKTTLDKLFSTGEDIVINEKLNNKEIYLLAGLFVSNINNINIKNIYFNISKNMLFPLDKLKEALLNPTKTLYLTNNTRINDTNIHELGADTIVLFFNLLNDDLIYFQLKPINDDFFDFQLNFIFSCIAIIKRNGNIVLDFWPNTFTSEKYINGFKTIIHSLKQQNIPITKLSLWTDKISDEQQFALANALKINKTVKKISIKATKYD